MGIAQKVSREFADGVRARGQSYFAKGRVAVTSAKAGEIVVAKVRGTEAYKVKLRVRGTRLHASCTCPYFGPEGEPCKHLWATILAADAKGLLQAVPVRPLKLVPDVRFHIQQQPPGHSPQGPPPENGPPPGPGPSPYLGPPPYGPPSPPQAHGRGTRPPHPPKGGAYRGPGPGGGNGQPPYRGGPGAPISRTASPTPRPAIATGATASTPGPRPGPGRKPRGLIAARRPATSTPRRPRARRRRCSTSWTPRPP